MCFSSLRSQHDEKMTQFFKNNFSEDRWRKAALKNAFSLLGKQRFEQSAAFFLLAGSLKDAIEVWTTYPQTRVHSTTHKIHIHTVANKCRLCSNNPFLFPSQWELGIALIYEKNILSVKCFCLTVQSISSLIVQIFAAERACSSAAFTSQEGRLTHADNRQKKPK